MQRNELPTGPVDDEDGPDVDVVFDILSNRRRRFVLHYLLQQDGAVDLRELSRHVTAWENRIGVEEITYKQRKRVYTALRQTHLPTMEDAGVIAYDSRSGEVEPTATGASFDVYVDVVRPNEIPWNQYFLGLGAIYCLATVVVAVVPPFSELSGLPLAALFAGVLTASGVVHSYLAYRRRLGCDGPPPESKAE